MIRSVDVAKVIGSGREELNSRGTDAHLKGRRRRRRRRRRSRCL
jgi:hypothetical protein